MAKITFLGGEETGNVGSIEWSGVRFELNKPVEVTDPYMVAKAGNNRFFKVEGAKAKIIEGTMAEDDKTRAEKESSVVAAQAAYPPEEEVDDKAEEEEAPVKRGPGRPRKVQTEDDD